MINEVCVGRMEPDCNGLLYDERQREMLGSVKQLQESEAGDRAVGVQLRTSARVSKKLKLDSQVSVATSDVSVTQPTTAKKAELEEKPITIPIIENKSKGRRVHETSVWSPDDKNAFFESLNEFGKDFDSIHHYIELKAKKRGEQDPKNRDQVRHFYYRTWQKISKHLRFPNGMKKVTQELYGLINFGEFRKKIGFVTEKNSYKLNEMIYLGSTQIRIKGKTWRLKTPICKALRKLNALEDCTEEIKLPSRVIIELRPRNNETWARVQSLSHNPRVCTELSLHRRLVTLLSYLQARWRTNEEKRSKELAKAIKAANSVTSPVSFNASSGLPSSSTTLLSVSSPPPQQRLSSPSSSEFLSSTFLPSDISEQSESPASSFEPTSSSCVVSSCLASTATSSELSISTTLPEPLCSSPPSSPTEASALATCSEVISSTCSNEVLQEVTFSASEPISSTSLLLLSTVSAANVSEDVLSSTSTSNMITSGPSIQPYISSPVIPGGIDELERLPDIHEYDDDEWELRVAPQPGSQMVETSYKMSAVITSGKLGLLSNGSRQGKDYSYILSELQVASKTGKMRVGSMKRARTDSSSEKSSPTAATTPPKGFAENGDQYDTIAADIENQIIEMQNNDAQLLSIQCEPFSFDNFLMGSSLSPNYNGECVSPVKEDFEPDSITETREKATDVFEKMKSGWTLRNSGTTRIGELYIMFGSNSKLTLDYWWERTQKPAQDDDQPIASTSKAKTNLVYRAMNDAISEVSPQSETSSVALALQKLVSLAKLSYRKSKVECPCGHICYSNSASTVNKSLPRNRVPSKLQWHLDETLEKTTSSSVVKPNNVERLQRVTTTSSGSSVSTVVTLSTATVSTTTVSGTSQPIVCQPLVMDGVFRRPLLAPAQPKTSTTDDLKFKAQLDKFRLSRYCQRRGRFRSKNVVVPRMLPLLPKIPPNNLMLKVVKRNEPGGYKRIMPKNNSQPATGQSQGQVVAYPVAVDTYTIDALDDTGALISQQAQEMQETERQMFFEDDLEEEDTSPVQQPDTAVQQTELDLELAMIKMDSPGPTTGQSSKTVANQPPDEQMFEGLLSNNEDESILHVPEELCEEQPTSLTKLLKDDVLFNADDYSLSSLLGHLDSPEKSGQSVCDDRSNSCDNSRLPDVDAQLHSLMCEDSIDYMGKFADLAAQITSESNANK